MEEQRKNFTFGGTGGTGNNRAGGTGNPGNSVVVRYALLLPLFGGGMFLLMAFGFVYVAFEVGVEDVAYYLFIVVPAIIGISFIIVPFVHSIVFHNNGITRKVKICLFGVTLVDRSTTILTWNSVIGVDYKHFKNGSLFVIKYTKPRGLFNGTFVFTSYTNYEDALRYSVGKIPARLFSDRAVDKLKSMGIRFGSNAAAGTGEAGGTGNKKPEPQKSNLRMVVILVVGFASAIGYSYLTSGSLTVDGNGITNRWSGFTPWDAVTEVDYIERRRSKGTSKIVVYSKSGKTYSTYYKDWKVVKIVAKNVPDDKFTDNARRELARWGVRTDD